MRQLPDAALLNAGRRLLAVDKLRKRLNRLDTQLKPLLPLLEQWQRDVHARCAFRDNPALLAGVIEHYQRGDTTFCRTSTQWYAFVVNAMFDKKFPWRVDYSTLIPAARPYLLAPYIDAKVGNAYPLVCFERSRPARGRYTYVSKSGPIDIATWHRALPTISGWLGDNWVVAAATVDTVTIERRIPLPAIMPFAEDNLSSGALFLGTDVNAYTPVHLPFAEMTSGTFIPGASGTGKSNALEILLQSIFSNLDQFAAVYLIDGKDGVGMNRFRNVAPGKVHVLWEEQDLWTLTTELVATMRARNAAQREAGLDNTTSDFIAVIIDEMSTYTQRPSSDAKNPDNKRHAQFIDELAMLARRGRSTGFRLVITAQEPVVDQIPATVRGNCLTTISFKLPIDAHAIAVFGQLEHLPADPRNLQRGRALIKNGLTGDIRHVQFPVLENRR